MAITTILNMSDLQGLSPLAQINLNRVLTWIGEVNATVGANTAELRVVADTAALKAIAAANRANLDVAFLADSGQCLYFSAASVAAEALGPPITVVAPTAGTGRWLALALPPALSVAAAQLTTGAVTEAKLGAASVTATKLGIAAPGAPSAVAVGGPSYNLLLTVPNTAGDNDYTLPAIGLLIDSATFIPNGTVGALSTIQIQTAAGAANVTEALDIAAATAGLVKDFATVSPSAFVFAASAGIRVATAGADVAGTLVLRCTRVS